MQNILLMRNRPWWLIVLLVLSITGCVRIVPGLAGHDDKIRVLIFKGVSRIDIKGSDRGSLEIRGSGGEVRVNGKVRSLPLRLHPEDEYVYVNSRPYRGTIEIAGSRDGFLVINEINLEAYLVGIINNEISSRWPEDVIKTQAVIARTYAIFNRDKRLKSPWHVESSVMGQVYSGAGSEDSTAMRAVMETRGEILTFSDEPALTVYHSNAGGMTDAASNVWFRDYPYLTPVESPFDSTAPKFFWDFALPAASLKELLNKAGYRMDEPDEIELVEITDSGRVKTLLVKCADGHEARLSGEDLRKIIGYSTLKSTLFEVSKEGVVFTFRGKGSGHGVGLSQWGAKGMAENGYSYKEILNHFYPGTELVKAY